MTYLEGSIPADVPLHRGTVGAMHVTAGTWQHQSRPYVYRGTGEDVMPEADLAEEERQRKREVARMKREAKMRRRYEQAQAWLERQRAEREAEAARIRAEYDSIPLAKVIPLFPNGAPPVPVPEPPPDPPLYRRRTRSPARWVDSRPKGPSPGWKAPKGADLEDWLDD